jgi:hypothetical protein
MLKSISIETILEENPNIIISVIGPHAGEDLPTIFQRKIADIKVCGYTYWICKSRVISSEIIRSFLPQNKNDLYIIFIKTATNSQGKDTLKSEAAIAVKETDVWEQIDNRLTPITGKMPAFGFKFESISVVKEGEKFKINLENYGEWDLEPNKRGQPVKIMMGKSTICVSKSNKKNEMKNGVREIVAFAKLADPFCMKFTNHIDDLNDSKKKSLKKRKNDGQKLDKKNQIKKKIKK